MELAMSSDICTINALSKTIEHINGFDALESFQTQIAKAIQYGRVAFLTGAGISVARSTFGPNWQDMMQNLLAEIAAITKGKKYPHSYDGKYFKPRMKMFFNEHVLQLIHEHLDVDAAVQVVTEALPQNHSCIHRFLVLCSILYDCPILTTNFDGLERSAFDEGLKQGAFGNLDDKNNPETIFKKTFFLHGERDKPETIKIRTKQVLAPLSPKDKTRLQNLLRDKVLIVLGYNGQDDFDVMPYLFEDENNYPEAIIWIVHNGSHNREAGPPLNMPEHRNHPKLHSLHIGDTDLLLQGIYKRIVEEGKKITKDTEKWLPKEWKDKCSEDDKDYWKKKISSWGQELRDKKPLEMLELWGAILKKNTVIRCRWTELCHTNPGDDTKCLCKSRCSKKTHGGVKDYRDSPCFKNG